MTSELQRAITRTALRESDATRHSGEFYYRVRPGSSTSVASQRVEASPAYLLEWDASGCRRTFLATADELRAALDAGRPTIGKDDGTEPPQRLFVVHGLPADFVLAIRSSLDIDPAFIEAHAGRRRYRPLRWRQQARFFCYEYPELIRGYQGGGRRRGKDGRREASSERIISGDGGGSDVGSGKVRARDAVDLLSDPVIKPIAEDDDVGMAAVFCRASLWVTDQADVLFVERPFWQDPSSPLRKARRQSSVTKPYTVQKGNSTSGTSIETLDVKLADGDEIYSLEDTLQETLKDAAKVGDQLPDILSDLAYDCWLELLELLPPQPHRTHSETLAFYWQILQCLEHNANVTAYLRRMVKASSPRFSAADWADLLSRIHARINLLPLAPQKPIPLSTASSKTGATADGGSSKKISRHATYNSSLKASSQRSQAGSGKVPVPEENQRALDRLSYLGGILLPLPIVASILSMGDTFGPTGPLFYLFWAVSVPLAGITVLIIYADTIRKAEVWVEVTAEHVAAVTGQHVGLGDANGVLGPHDKIDLMPFKVGIDRTETINFRPQPNGNSNGVPASNGNPLRRTNHAITFNIGHEETVIGLPVTSSGVVDEDAVVDRLEDIDEPLEEPQMILEQPADGSKPKAWKRQQLGWYGAAKAIVGYGRTRKADDVPPGVVAYDKRETPSPNRGRRQTRTL